MDFYKIKERTLRSGVIEIYPDFKVCRSKDLMIEENRFMLYGIKIKGYGRPMNMMYNDWWMKT